MIEKDHILQAIGVIAAQAPDLGRELEELVRGRRIEVSRSGRSAGGGIDPSFLFDGREVIVRKFVFFSEGPAALVPGLLMEYGAARARRALRREGTSLDERDRGARDAKARRAGLELMIDHTIDHTIAHLGARTARGASPADGEPPLKILRRIRKEDCADTAPLDETHPAFLFKGVIAGDRPALFMRFPLTRGALSQAAERNLEFFSPHFLLKCIETGHAVRLHACVVDGEIAGLIFLDIRDDRSVRGIEIKYMATVSGHGESRHEVHFAELHGIGTFLVAGVWMLSRNIQPLCDEIYLDSEVGSVGFYESLGFRRRRPGLYAYSLHKPAGALLQAILRMAYRSPWLPERACDELEELITRQVEQIARRRRGKNGKRRGWKSRGLAANGTGATALVRECLQQTFRPALRRAAASAVIRRQSRLTGGDELVAIAAGIEARRGALMRGGAVCEPLRVVCSERFTEHLEEIFHLESANRVRALQSVLQDPSLAGRWDLVTPRSATVDELRLVHTAEHIERVARTASFPLSSLDRDTQATSRSYLTARLAVGALFNLLDTVWIGPARRGFAGIRPPGHHAEPDRAMGFCLFNNIALGARYLQEVHGAQRLMIIDIDTHHGNGTQAVFYDTNTVLYLSLHQFPGFPGTGALGEVGSGRGEGFTVNIPLSHGLGDRELTRVLYEAALPIAHLYRPEMILVSCGFDLYQHDRLGTMHATPEGYAQITRLLVETADEVCQGRIVFVMEGGYSVMGIEGCGLRVLQELCRVGTPCNGDRDGMRPCGRTIPSVMKKVIEVQRRYWDFSSVTARKSRIP